MLLIIGRLLNQIPSFHYSQQTRKIPNMAFTFNWLVRNQFWRRKCLIWNEGEWLFDSIYRRSWVFRNDTVKFLKEIFCSDEVLLNWAFLKLYLQELDFHVFFTFRMWLDKHWYKTTTVSADECLFWNDIFEEWPKAEINEFGIRTMEFLPNFKPFNESSQIEMEWFSGLLGFPGVPYSIQNLTYITWQDNRFVY